MNSPKGVKSAVSEECLIQLETGNWKLHRNILGNIEDKNVNANIVKC